MTMKPCLACGELSDRNRCPNHRPKDNRDRRARGYDWQWDELSRRARRLQPFCSDCGATEDLQADHLPRAWKRKAEGKAIRLADVDVVCGRCNRRRGSARPGGQRATWGGGLNDACQAPEGKAQGGYTPDENEPIALRDADVT
jgi:5-methylcytosine-specific restriction enzyme A